MSERVVVPGGRDVRASLDPANGSDTCVVACPPHPRRGGDRRDSRVLAASDALGEWDVACLRVDYGPWDEGRGERRDVENGVAWGRERYPRVGLFGYSFGAAVAIEAASVATVDAVSALAPPADPTGDLDPVAALDRIDCPLQVIEGERDESVATEPVVTRARKRGFDVVSIDAGHRFVGERATAGEAVASFVGANS